MAGDEKKIMKKEKINDETCKLYIGGISPSWSSDKIKDVLEKLSGCTVMRVDVVKNFAFAFVANKAVGDKLIEKVHGNMVEDNKLVIQVSKNKQNLPDSEDLCFECGKPGHWAKECAKRRARMSTRRRFDRPIHAPPPLPPIRERDPYGYAERRYPPVARERDLYARAYELDPYTRDYYARDPYYPYHRDIYGYPVSRYAYEYGRYEASDPYAPRSAPPSSRDSAYAAERERLAYGRSTYPESAATRTYETAPGVAAASKSASETRDPYAVVSRRAVDPYESARRPDPYEASAATRSSYAPSSYVASTYPASSYPASSYSAYSSVATDPLARSADPYDISASRDRYASDPAPKRYPEPAYAPRMK